MRTLLRGLAGLLLCALVAVAIAWLAGAFHEKVGAGAPAAGVRAARQVGDAALADVRLITRPRIEQAVGSVRAVHETQVASRILAAVREITVRAGDEVKAGEVLARLDDEALRARVRQTDASTASAQAVLANAETELRRTRELVAQRAASQSELDRADTAVATARSEVERLTRMRDEANAMLDHATVRAPMDGVVVERSVEPGDTVSPGRTIVTLYDPTRMQLVAAVRESLTRDLVIGEEMAVRIDALDLDCHGTIAEIVPRAAAASRTFDVKVTGPCPPGAYSGMFGRLLIPLGDESVLVVPAGAVRTVGQLRLVDVAEGDRLHRRAVQVGRVFGDDVEVLSGLREGERVALAE